MFFSFSARLATKSNASDVRVTTANHINFERNTGDFLEKIENKWLRKICFPLLTPALLGNKQNNNKLSRIYSFNLNCQSFEAIL